jgi:hypothetical protein
MQQGTVVAQMVVQEEVEEMVGMQQAGPLAAMEDLFRL